MSVGFKWGVTPLDIISISQVGDFVNPFLDFFQNLFFKAFSLTLYKYNTKNFTKNQDGILHKIMGKTLCILPTIFCLTKLLGCDIMENSADFERPRRAKIRP